MRTCSRAYPLCSRPVAPSFRGNFQLLIPLANSDSKQLDTMTHPSIARVCKCYSAVRCYTGHTGVARCTGVHWCCTGVDWSAFQSSLQTIERAASCAGTTASRTLETSQRPDSIVILSIPQIDRGEIDSWRASRVVARLINRKHGAHLVSFAVLQSSAAPHRCFR